MSDLEDKTRQVLLEWVSRIGHDRCFWHPELLSRLGELYGVDMSRSIGQIPLETFQRGCRLYQAITYGLPIPEDCRDIEL